MYLPDRATRILKDYQTVIADYANKKITRDTALNTLDLLQREATECELEYHINRVGREILNTLDEGNN